MEMYIQILTVPVPDIMSVFNGSIWEISSILCERNLFWLVTQTSLGDFTRWNECLEPWLIEDSGLVGCDAVSLH